LAGLLRHKRVIFTLSEYLSQTARDADLVEAALEQLEELDARASRT